MAPARTKDKFPGAAAATRRRRPAESSPVGRYPLASTSTLPFISLQTYISNVFYLVHIQDQDDISEAAFEKNWSKEGYHAMVNGQPFNRPQIHTFVKQQREAMSNRQLVSHTFLIVPSDNEGRSGTIADTVKTTSRAVLDGVEQDVVAITTAVIVVEWDEKNGRRVIQSENLAFVIKSKSDS